MSTTPYVCRRSVKGAPHGVSSSKHQVAICEGRAKRGPWGASSSEQHHVRREEEEVEEEEESLFKADAVNEEDPERDRATQV